MFAVNIRTLKEGVNSTSSDKIICPIKLVKENYGRNIKKLRGLA